MRRALATEARRPAAALLELTKYRIALSLALAATAGFLLAGGPAPEVWRVFLPVFLVSLGASAWNQVLEQDIDALLPRTRHRPLPARRMTPRQALLWGMLFLVAGLLWWRGPAQWLLLGGALLYVFGYTPLKRRTAWALALGALVGAMPVLVGALYAGRLSPEVLLAFLALYFWQYPHTYALHAWEAPHWEAAGLPYLRGASAHAICLAGASLLAALAMGALFGRMMGLTGVLLAGALLAVPSRPLWRLWRWGREEDGRALFLSSLLFLTVWLVSLNLIAWRWS